MTNTIAYLVAAAGIALGSPQTGAESATLKRTGTEKNGEIAVDAGTRIPLSMINSISTSTTVL